MDEASQAAETSVLIPFKYNSSVFVLVGDPCQLPAVILSGDAKSRYYDQSLFQVMFCVCHGAAMKMNSC